jgi:hypothetical protein
VKVSRAFVCLGPTFGGLMGIAMNRLILLGLVALCLRPTMTFAQAAPERPARRMVSAFDRSQHVRPPLAHYRDGTTGELVVDADWLARAERYRREHPAPLAAAGDVTRVGEVLVLQPTPEMVMTTGGQSFAIGSLQAITSRVIEFAGDDYHTITLWTSFQDDSNEALAYALNVRNEVAGLGAKLEVRDLSKGFGSAGTLRTVVNMKEVALRATDNRDSWDSALEVWGQEVGHRFMVFLRARIGDRSSDILLGRDCAHFHRFVDTQASVQDGFSWTDNNNGTFTKGEENKRYGNLDLYGFGLMPRDEVPPFFAIVDIPGYEPPNCSTYGSVRPPTGRVVQGRRQDITINDIIAANGARTPERDSGYWKELQVVVLRPGESPSSATAVGLATRIDRARVWWEQWAQTNSQRRLVVCTRSTGDCGDPRSDVAAIDSNVGKDVPGQAPVSFKVDIANSGGRLATGVTTWMSAVVGDRVFASGPPKAAGAGSVMPGQTVSEQFSLDLTGVACGSEAVVTAWTQSDHHYDRMRTTALLGTESKRSDTFEAVDDEGWVVNADGNDSSLGARWERGTPQASFLLASQVQPGAAHGGSKAWVTGLAPTEASAAGYVRAGKTTLDSPAVDARGLLSPTLRFWLSFAGVRSSPSAIGIETSPDSRLFVAVQSLVPGDGGVVASGWRDIDVIAGTATNGWVQRTARLPADLDLGGQIQFRFTAADLNDGSGAVEAAIDDVEVVSLLPACVAAAPPIPITPNDDTGCGCRIGVQASRVPPPVWVVMLVAVVGLFRGRVRRTRSK